MPIKSYKTIEVLVRGKIAQVSVKPDVLDEECLDGEPIEKLKAELLDLVSQDFHILFDPSNVAEINDPRLFAALYQAHVALKQREPTSVLYIDDVNCDWDALSAFREIVEDGFQWFEAISGGGLMKLSWMEDDTIAQDLLKMMLFNPKPPEDPS